MKQNRQLTFISFYGPDENMAASVRLQRMISAFTEWGWTVDLVTPATSASLQAPEGKIRKWLIFTGQILDLTLKAYRHRKTDLFYISAPPHGMILVATI